MNATLVRSTVLVLMASAVLTCRAGTVNLADVPLGNSIDPAVKPNIMFILDKSGSMAWTHMPDDPLDKNPHNMLSTIGYKSSQCNGVYYNPDITYMPPVHADGTSYPNATFTSAWQDGFDTSAGTVNLNTSFRAYTTSTLSGASYSGNDTAQAAYYYQYNGANGTGTVQPAMSYSYNSSGAVQTGTTFYAECNAATATAGSAANHTWTKVVINTSSSTASQQNFANWYSYYRVRINMMKSAAGLALKQLNNPAFLRLGLVYHDFSSFTALADYSDTTGVTNTCPGTTQRAKLYCALYDASPGGGTPTRTALSKIARIYEHTLSGYADPVQYKCQRNSAILATDGFWNGDCGSNCGIASGFTSVGNADSGGSAPSNDTSPASTNSMADIAAYYYNTHIRSALDAPTPPATDAPIATCPQVPKEGWVRQTAADCATYVHMNTFTLGLGGSGTLDYVWGYQTAGVSPDYDAIVGGTLHWPNPIPDENVTRMDDLWHAAVDGHGLYFAASNASTLANGLKQAFAAAAETGGAGAPAASSLTPSPGDSSITSGYKTDEWSGDVAAFAIDPATGIVSTTQLWSAQTLLDARTTTNSDTRTIYMASGTSLVPFTAGNLAIDISNHWFDAGPTNPSGQLEQYQFFSAAQIAAATPASVIAYIRGQRGLEDTTNDTTNTNASKLYRGRTHVLGDIVNSSPVLDPAPNFDYQDAGYQSFKTAHASRAGVVYVGANDGMLHAFDATTGAEKWAFVPTAVIPNLYKLADKNYNVKHHFYVDGWITVGDVDFGSSDWHTVLIGGLGKGGRAYYALDITNPNSPTLLWEFAATAAATATGTVDADLGYTPDGAQMSKLKGGTNNGKWVATFASGYNNTSPGDGQARLYVVDVKTGAKMDEIVTAGGSDPLLSGIGWIQGWTDDGMKDNSAKDVYSGDLSGRIWRFDMVAQTATLLTTLGSAAVKQPVSTRVELGKFANDVNQRVIYVGTGRYLGYCDIDPTAYATTCPAGSTYYPINAVQSLYAIRDTGNSLKSNVGNPYFRSVAIPLATGDRNGTMTYNNVTTNSNGWFMDFTAQPGERVTIQPRLDLLTQNTLTVATNVPASDKCDVGGSSWLYTLETQPAKSHVALPNTWISLGSTLAEGFSNLTLQNGAPVVVVTRSDGTTVTITGTPQILGNNVRRISWRELAN